MAEVIFASSYDERNPPSNIFSNNNKEFFASTGMFPQELCIQFETERIVKAINISQYGIKRIEIQTCENDSVVSFTKQAEQSEVPMGSSLQNISLNLTQSPRVKVLKVVIVEGYEDFFTVHKVTIN